MVERTPRAARDVLVPESFDIRPFMSSIGSQLAGPANVIMQLSLPGVGHGVVHGGVPDGSAMLHPFKRARTTFSYLAVALLGDDDERTAFRRAVNAQHVQVTSEPGAAVTYRAMDPRLQLWVAACLYYGTVDLVDRMHGPLGEADADALYAYCGRYGTTLQVRAADWPASRSDFADYWQAMLSELHLDDTVRDYLLRLTALENLPAPVRRPLAGFTLFVTTGFLPHEFREQMRLTWSVEDQRRFDRLLRRLGRVDDLLPVPLRILPFNLLRLDLRLRRRLGRRLA